MATSPAAPAQPQAFRRQFFLGPEVPDVLAGWKALPGVDGFRLSVHPDLPATRAEVGGRVLILLGYVLDPRHPERDDQTIVDGALRQGSTFDKLIAAFHPLAGRWAVIYCTDGQTYLFHDTVGSRQVYYCHDDEGTWVASSPGLLARATGRPRDAASVELLESEGVFREGFTHFWPGDGSPIVGVKRLLPNHFLNATTGQAQRFWPTSSLRQLAPDEGAAVSKVVLTGGTRAAANRYPLALSLTAGFDSRLVLAAARDVRGQIAYYTYRKPGMSMASPDIRVPRKILGDQGLRHKVITVKPSLDSDVVAAISASVSPFHRNSVRQATALLSDPPRHDGPWATLNGNIAEVAQCRLSRLPVTPENLAQNSRMPGSTFAMKHLAQWHEQAADALASSGVDPWDLLYWEHKMGGWYSTIRTEFDLVEEVVTPYNSREWLQGMLGVDPALRGEPEWTFFRDLIGDLWPELLDYPFNPSDPVGRVYHRARLAGKSLLSRVRPSSRRPVPRS